MDTNIDPVDDLLETVFLYHEKYIETPKFQDGDIAAEPELKDLALDYLAKYTGNFAYILDIKEKNRGNLSTGQVRGILNTMLAEKRRRDNPITDEPINGIALNGYYLMPGQPELQIKPWREDGTRMLLVNTGGEWEGFASIAPDHNWRMWGKHNHGYLPKLAKDLLQATTKQRDEWQAEWANFTAKCAMCGTKPQHEHNVAFCPECASGAWATTVIGEAENLGFEMIPEEKPS